MKLSLVVMTPGKSEGKAIPITLAQFLIGRDPQCQLRPASASISKRHCAILVRSGKVFVRDLDSTNGTFVNETPVKGEVELHHDDKLKIGPLLFGVCIEAKKLSAREATPAPANTPPAPVKPTPPPGKSGEPVDDESVAAWLLSLQDEGTPTPGGSDEVPGGSTVVLDQLPDDTAKINAPTADPGAKGKPGAASPSAAGDTADVARAILQKYMRRPRG